MSKSLEDKVMGYYAQGEGNEKRFWIAHEDLVALVRLAEKEKTKELLRVAEDYVNSPRGIGDFSSSDEVVTMCYQGDATTARDLFNKLKSWAGEVKG